MSAPIVAKQTNYLKDNVPYYKYYQTTNIETDSQELFSDASATVGGTPCYTSAYSFKGSYSSGSATFPSAGSGMATSIVTPSSYNNTDCTLSAWIKLSQSNQKGKTIWGCHSDNTQSGISFGIDDGQADKIKFHEKSYHSFYSNTRLSVDTWYFIVCVYDRTNLEERIYINGQLDATRSFSSSEQGYTLPFLYSWKAGFWSSNGTTSTTVNGATQFFLGNIINCCTWYRALSQSEITTLYNNGDGLVIDTNVAPYTDVEIAFPMNESSGTTAYSAISGQSSGVYGNSTTYNQHVEDSVFVGSGTLPQYLYITGSNWETNLQVSSNAEFVSNLTITKAIYPTKLVVTLNNTTPKNPVNLILKGSNDMTSWTSLGTISIPSNTNQVVEMNVTSLLDYKYFQLSTTQAYETTGLTINNITIEGYWKQTSEVGMHDSWDTQVQEGTHTVLSNSSDYDTIEYQNKEYEVQNV